MQVFLVRHAESANNYLAEQLYQQNQSYEGFRERRAADPPLTRRGEEQAAVLADYLSSHPPKIQPIRLPDDLSQHPITEIVTSPMRRALQTTAPVSAALGIPAQVWVDIHEHGGMFDNSGPNGQLVPHSGLTRSQIQELLPGAILPPEVTEEGWWFQEGEEDMAGCFARAFRVAERLYEMAREEAGRQEAGQEERTLLMVTHGTFLGALFKALFHNAPANHFFVNHFNTGISQLSFTPEAFMIVRYINRVDHLPRHLVS